MLDTKVIFLKKFFLSVWVSTGIFLIEQSKQVWKSFDVFACRADADSPSCFLQHIEASHRGKTHRHPRF